LQTQELQHQKHEEFVKKEVELSKQNNVLIATYVHEYKDYSFDKWLARAIEIALHHGNSDILIVDNSDNDTYVKSLVSRVKKAKANIFENPLNCDLRIIVGKVSDSETPLDNTRIKQKASQDILWKQALEGGYSHLMIIESDIYPPVNVIAELLKFNVPICSALYSLRNQELYDDHKKMLEKRGTLDQYKDEEIGDFYCLVPEGKLRRLSSKDHWQRYLAHKREVDQLIKEHDEKDPEGKLPMRIYAAGLGCILIQRWVLQLIKPETISPEQVKYFKEVLEFAEAKAKELKYKDQYLLTLMRVLHSNFEHELQETMHPDTNFYILCNHYRISRYVHPHLEAEHDRSNWRDVKFR